jgi:hypothetical protein
MAQHEDTPHWTLLLKALRELTAEAEERLGFPKSSPADASSREAAEEGEESTHQDASSSDAGSEQQQHAFRNLDMSRRAVVAHEINSVRDRMLRMDADFNENSLGYRDFENFALMAASLNILAVSMTGTSKAGDQPEETQGETGKCADERKTGDVDHDKDNLEANNEVVWIGEREHIKLMPGNLVRRGESTLARAEREEERISNLCLEAFAIFRYMQCGHNL